MKAEEIMAKKVLSLPLNADISEAINIFAYHNFKSIPIVDKNKKLLGVVWQNDLFRSNNNLHIVQEALSPVFLKTHKSTSSVNIVRTFLQNPKCSIIYIVDDDEKLVGIISKNDILNLFLEGKINTSSNLLSIQSLLSINNEIPLIKAFESLHEGVVIVDRDTKVIFANDAYMRIIGVHPHHVLNKKLSDIEPKAKIINVLKTGIPVFESKIKIESVGVTIIANINPIIINNTIVGAISSFFDITEIIDSANELERIQIMNRYLENELEKEITLPESFQAIIGRSKELKTAMEIAARVAMTDANILILGESGTGKELIAKAVHDSSKRKDNPFVKINCSAIPENLIESELFGYEEGAFTGARKRGKKGKIELSNKGTLFLDEIGDMPIFMQPKLLRFLQEKQYEKVGGEITREVDVRIIAATNKDPENLIREGSFRKDLYYRINTFTINLPPLRERKVDVMDLIDYYISYYNQQYEKKTVCSNRCLDIFLEYDWPGNVRELKNVIEHSVVLCDSDKITEENIPDYFNKLIHNKPKTFNLPENNIKKMKEMISKMEKDSIIQALNLSDFNKTKAMDLLGISRRAFYNKLKKYGIR